MTRQRPAPPASTTPASRRTASWPGVRLEGGAGAVGGGADDRRRGRPPGVDRGDRGLRAGAGDGEEGALLRVGDRAVGGVGGLLQRGGEGRTVGGRLTGELVGEAAQELGEDRAGVAARTEDRARGRAPTRRTRWCGDPSASSAATAACAVSSRLVPVSPSGTGKTLSSSSRLLDADRASTAARYQAPTAASSSACSTGGGYPWGVTGAAVSVDPGSIGGCGDIRPPERLDFSTVLMRVLSCPAVVNESLGVINRGCRVRCVWQGARFRYVGVALAPPHAAPLEPEHPVRAGAHRPRQPSPDQRVHLVHPRRQGRARLT